MLPIVLVLSVFAVGPSSTFPVDIPSVADLIDDGSYGSWNSDIYCKGISCSRAARPYDKYIAVQSNDILDLVAPTVLSSDLLTRFPVNYPAYPRTIDIAKENFVRGSVAGTTEVGTRDEVTLRPSLLRSPFSRFYSSYHPYNLLRNGVYRYPADSVYSPLVADYGLQLKRPLGLSAASPLPGRLAPDSLYI